MSSEPCVACGAICPYADGPGECWGVVNAVDEITLEDGDYVWAHACKGHEPVYHGYAYRPKET